MRNITPRKTFLSQGSLILGDQSQQSCTTMSKRLIKETGWLDGLQSLILVPVLLSLTLEEIQTLSRAYLSFPGRVSFPGRSGYLNSRTHQSSYQIVRRASRSTHAPHSVPYAFSTPYIPSAPAYSQGGAGSTTTATHTATTQRRVTHRQINSHNSLYNTTAKQCRDSTSS